ncbi:MAG: ubiquinone/menaquinone biosynthesis methyltransferase [Leptospiraceae bacterium]|nr:ubiquinone/menaquinone biosynthesis methyltransferase [Leptospiraceae bacterium]
MSDFQMPSVEKKAEFVRTNFDIIASKYDLFNDLNSFFLHRLWKNQIPELIRSKLKKNNLNCLDLCCGTGDISVRLANMQETEKLFAVDFSENMIDVARHRLMNKSNSIVQIGDATNLKDFSNESLDVVTVGFGLRNVDNLDGAISEIHRVLKKGGLFLNLDVGKVKNPIIRLFADFYFFKIVPILGYIIWGGKNKMFDYLPVSSLTYPAQEELATKLTRLGFQNVGFKNFVFGNAVLHFGEKV